MLECTCHVDKIMYDFEGRSAYTWEKPRHISLSFPDILTSHKPILPPLPPNDVIACALNITTFCHLFLSIHITTIYNSIIVILLHPFRNSRISASTLKSTINQSHHHADRIQPRQRRHWSCQICHLHTWKHSRWYHPHSGWSDRNCRARSRRYYQQRDGECWRAGWECAR